MAEPYVFKVKGGRRIAKPDASRPDTTPIKVKTETIFGSSLEDLVYQALLAAGWRPEDIQAQVPINGGRSMPGGQVLDFVVGIASPIPIEVNGEYWHQDEGIEFEASTAVMERYGREPVVIWGDECTDFEAALATVRRKVGVP